jgi:hypothetical protein
VYWRSGSKHSIVWLAGTEAAAPPNSSAVLVEWKETERESLCGCSWEHAHTSEEVSIVFFLGQRPLSTARFF